ncbi:MAG: SRPBCC family protein [Bacteroidota bacterium]
MVTSSIIIKAPATKIWAALTEIQQMKEWYFDIPDFVLEVGKTFNFYESDKKEYHHRCVIKEIETNKKFSHTWTHPSHSKGESIVTWHLQEENNQTKVTLTHQGIENFADGGAAFAPENYKMGWDGFMSILKNYINGLKKIKYTTTINASPEKVWNTLFNDETYRQWTSAFTEGSHYKGDLKQGGRIHFLSPSGGGLYSNVFFLVPNKNVMFQHIGEIKNFEEQAIDDEAEKWTGCFENYTLKQNGNEILLEVEIDMSPENIEHMNDIFPKALANVKAIAEKN